MALPSIANHVAQLIYYGVVNRLWVVCAIVAMVAGSLGCGSKSSAPTSASTTSDVAPFAGTWTANVLPSGVTELPGCTDFTYTVTPTGLTMPCLLHVGGPLSIERDPDAGIYEDHCRFRRMAFTCRCA